MANEKKKLDKYTLDKLLKMRDENPKVFPYLLESLDAQNIDVPDSLFSVPIYRCNAEFLILNGNLQLASGYIGMSEKLEKDYLQLTATKKSRQYILRQPLQDFIK